MLNYLNKILMEEIKEGSAGGTPPAKSDDKAPGATDDKKTETDGNNLDQFGYAKEGKADDKKGEASKEGNPEEKVASKEPAKVEKPVTGYDAEPPKVEEPPPEKKEEKPPVAPTELDKKLEGFNDQWKTYVKGQLDELGLEGEKLDKFINLKKAEAKVLLDNQTQMRAEAERQDKIQKASWHKELKEDLAFGGDKFLTNVSRGERVIEEYLPELKKELTEAKQMLRPSVMRGLARLADRLYPDDKMAHGDPIAPEGTKDEKKQSSPLDFYQ